MISQVYLVRRLNKERHRWSEEMQGDFVQGFIHGLTFAIALVNELGALTKERMQGNPHYLASLFRKGH